MKIELTDKEVALLIGLLSATSGQALNGLWEKLMLYASQQEERHMMEISMMLSEEVLYKLRNIFINEDTIYNDVIEYWNYKEGLI